MRERDDNNAPQQKPRSGNTAPYVSEPGEDLHISSNPNERANENLDQLPFKKSEDRSASTTGSEITDGEAG